MTKEKILDKLHSYNGNVVKIIFLLYTKKEYFESRQIDYVTKLEQEGFIGNEIGFNALPYVFKNEDCVHFLIFINSTMDGVEKSFPNLDYALEYWKKDAPDFFYLKENYCNYDKKEKRFLKAMSLLSLK